MSIATVTSDYKITLPKEIREAMHLQPGQEFDLIQNGSGIQMVPKLNERQGTGDELISAKPKPASTFHPSHR